MNRIDRLLGYLLVLQSRELVRAQDLAARFEVSERTVYRDMEALAEIGVPLLGMAGEGYRLLEGYHLPPIMFSESEARAIFLAMAMLTGLTAAGPTRNAAESALDKVRTILPGPTRRQVELWQAVLGFYSVRRPPLDLDDKKFIQLQEAISGRKVVYLHYHALESNRISAREVEPLQLAYVDNTWILHGYCRLRQDYRNFRLDRMDRLVIRRDTFAPRQPQLPQTPTTGQHLLVRFETEIVRWVRENQHFTFVAEVSTAEDGATTMLYQIVSLAQISRWLLSWGDAMEVLEPADIRAAICTLAARMSHHHAAA